MMIEFGPEAVKIIRMIIEGIGVLFFFYIIFG